jgi:alkanesulfonate monooxygenase SsuD/methylene tetrahydromethanopterin reductase-like flavin-dependent oxidoreductase (luciferase family)
LIKVTLHYDLRAPEFAPAIEKLYAAALEQCAWGDKLGFDDVVLSCHHGCEDNYCPSQIITATAIAARTKRIRVTPVVALPLHHPIHLAEDLAGLDIFSGGRLNVLLGAGYREAEFRMFGQSMAERGRRMEEGVTALVQAWTGEPFQFRGETIFVRPRPFQRPHPPIILGGATGAAARLGVQFYPVKGSSVYDDYAEACRDLGREAPPSGRRPSWMFLQVSEDPERTAALIAPYLLHVTNSYAKWLAETGVTTVYEPIESIAELRASGNFRIVTPEQCIELAREVDGLSLDPLFGGIPPEIAQEGLELFASKVLPVLREMAPAR